MAAEVSANELGSCGCSRMALCFEWIRANSLPLGHAHETNSGALQEILDPPCDTDGKQGDHRENQQHFLPKHGWPFQRAGQHDRQGEGKENDQHVRVPEWKASVCWIIAQNTLWLASATSGIRLSGELALQEPSIPLNSCAQETPLLDAAAIRNDRAYGGLRAGNAP